jgi:hypothetical protein
MRFISLSLAVVTALSAASAADAWTAIARCGGEAVPRENTFEVWRLRDTIPDGSDRAAAYFNALDQWAPANMISRRMVIDGVSLSTREDGYNDVAVVPRSVLGPGRDGTAIHVISTCFPYFPLFKWAKLQETDIRIADDLDFGNFDETNPHPAHGRSVFLHEFGHAHAMGENWQSRFSVTKEVEPYPLVGGFGSHHIVFGDDLLGARTVTFAGVTVFKNLFVSPQHWNGSNIANLMPSTTMNVCAGWTVNAAFTVGNSGIDVNDATNVGIEIFMSPWNPPDGYFGGHVVHSENIGSVTRASERTISRNVTVPWVRGVHRIYLRVDPGNTVGERSEDDNVAVSPTILNVVC